VYFPKFLCFLPTYVLNISRQHDFSKQIRELPLCDALLFAWGMT
jgi:hypothetical protein